MLDEYLSEIALRAATLDERLSDSFAPCRAEGADIDGAARRFAAWTASSANDDPDIFDRRLARDGLTREDVFLRLAGGNWRAGAPLPDWVDGATWIEPALRQSASAEFLTGRKVSENTIPFEDLLLGVVENADKRLWQASAPAMQTRVSANAAAALNLELAGELASLLAPVLYEIFAQKFPRPNKSAGTLSPTSSGHYSAFVEYMREQGFRLLFAEKPVLLRLVVVITTQWIEATVEFLNRFHNDLTAIAELAGVDKDITIAAAVVTGDLHNHGRAVRLVTLLGGHRVLYKPKDLTIDDALSTLISSLNATGAPFSQRLPRNVVRDQYGWTEFVEFLGCKSVDDLAQYFRRAGGWLCLFHVLGGVDMHEQNIIASGDFPVPVDLETLIQPAAVPNVSEDDPRRAYTLAGKEIAGSVLATGLLPGYGKSGREAIPHGGFIDTRDRKRAIFWADLNSDRMRPEARWEWINENHNIPHFEGQPATVQDFVNEVIGGYREYASFLIRYAKTVGAHALVEPFRGLNVRKLLKNTRFYSLLVERLKDHRRMHDGAIWSAQLDFVCRLANWTDDDDPWWPLIRAERAALSELNIPYFLMESSGSIIRDVDGNVADGNLEPGLTRVVMALQTLDDAQIERQSEIIRVSLSSVRPISESFERRAVRTARANSRSRVGIESEGDFRTRAMNIANHIERRAFRASSSAAWLGLDWLQDSSVCQIAPLGGDLYNGASGVCVFLAAQAKVGNDDRAADLARAGTAALRSDLLGPNGGRAARALGIGGATGLGSVIYAFATIAELTDDRKLLSDAERITQLLTDELIATDRVHDVMDGASGTILSLMKLHRLTGSTLARERMRACSRHVLDALQSESPVDRDVKSPLGFLPTGLSHGGAGIAYALSALASVTEGSEATELVTAASALVAAENKLFCEARSNWPDSRTLTDAPDTFWPCQWCHGAAGIGLARTATAKALQGRASLEWGDIDQDVERAVEAVVAAWPYATDSLCCGSLGGIELLRDAATHLGRPELRDLAGNRMSEIAREADAEGDYLWDISDSNLNLGLYRGVTGVGYTMLRQIDPSLPNVLVWE